MEVNNMENSDLLLVDVKENQLYQMDVLIGNDPYLRKFGKISQDSFFTSDMETKYDIKFRRLLIIQKEDKEEFIKMCNLHEIEFKFYDHLIFDYLTYRDLLTNEKRELESDDYDNPIEFKEVAQIEVPPIICTRGTSKFLYENTIKRKDKMRIFIGLNEKTNHFKPHIHAEYEGESYAVFDLIDLEVIKSRAKKGHNAKTKEFLKLIKDNLVNARTIWNKSSSLLKFPTIDDSIPYTLQLIKEKG